MIDRSLKSQAWATFNLPKPKHYGWVAHIPTDGWAVELDQHAYGFPTRKLTWLYVVGAPVDLLRGVTAARGCETLWSAERSRTPPAFRDVLLDMARNCGKELCPFEAAIREDGDPGLGNMSGALRAVDAVPTLGRERKRRLGSSTSLYRHRDV